MKEKQQTQEQITIQYDYYDWDLIIKRLRFHRERLNFSKEEMKEIIEQKYQCGFMVLPDEQIFELGMNFKNSNSKEDFYRIMETDVEKLNKEMKNKEINDKEVNNKDKKN